MKVPLSWLRDYVTIDISPEDLAERLTMAGVEVASLEQLGAEWDNVYVGEVVDQQKHPNADRLLIAQIDYGPRVVQVVTGATNMSVGDKVPLALPGARLLDGHSEEKQYITLKPSKLRGVPSEGMACSEKELGISGEHEGIMILDRSAPVGEPLAKVLGDVIFDLEITPNLAHDLSIVGIAREVAALTGKKLRLPPSDWQEGNTPIEEFVRGEVADPQLAPRYTLALIRNVEVKDSPRWMQDRLLKSGVRPINNIVDITNYVMLEWGQPQHAFDYDQVGGRAVIVRRARPGETIVTIDHVERTVTEDMLMIADAEVPIGVAGVMGGLSSEIGPETKNILLESANFDRVSIRRTSRALKLRSEASRRFERGLDPEMALPALRRASELMRQLAGGEIARGAVDIYSIRPETKTIRLTGAEIRRVLGLEVTLPKVVDILKSLGFEVEVPGAFIVEERSRPGGVALEEEEAVIMVTVPSFRGDVSLPADLVEEVARVYGYDKIPVTMMADALPEQNPNRWLAWESKVRSLMVAAGLSEMISYSLTNLGSLTKLRPEESRWKSVLKTVYGDADLSDGSLVRLANPLSAEREIMRPTLMGSLLETISTNMRHEERTALFEVGRTYFWQGPEKLPVERRALGIVMAGQRSPRTLFGDLSDVDFFDIKGVVELLLSRLAVSDVRFEPIELPVFHPGRAAAVRAAGRLLGVIGEVNPGVVEDFEIRALRVGLAEMDLEALYEHAAAEVQYSPIQRFPEVVQDVAVVVDEVIPARQVQDLLTEVGGGLLRSVALFDVYSGAPIPPGRRSLAFRLVYQAPGRTLTDKEVNRLREKMEGRLRKELGAELRSG